MQVLRVSSFLVVCVLLSPLSRAQDPLSGTQRHVERAGTALMFAIPASALLATWVLQPENPGAATDQPSSWLLLDGSPRHDLLVAIGRTAVATGVLKYAINETRPNGGSHSFPSGHSSAAFTGAEFIRKEYGWKWGAPAYAAAGFVGWSRVKADRHYTHDVLAGAAIGVLANHDFWRRENGVGNLRLGAGPVISAGRVAPGLQFEMNF